MTQVLDHGYIKLIEYMGSDERIIESARMSTGKGFISWDEYWECNKCFWNEIWGEGTPKLIVHPCLNCNEGELKLKSDARLLKHLYKNNHTTPFEMCEVTFEVQAPIFVFREWHRHRTQSYNEFSARYSELPNLFYVPSDDRISNAAQSKTNKQGSEQSRFNNSEIMDFVSQIEHVYRVSRESYEYLLKMGVTKEIARLVIPVSQYSKMRAKANLLNWLRFLQLRLPENAQWEIRQYANVVKEELTKLYPRTMELFNEEMVGK